MGSKTFRSTAFKRAIDTGKVSTVSADDLVKIWRTEQGDEKSISLADLAVGVTTKVEDLNTGFVYGLNLSINGADNTKFDIAAGEYVITNLADLDNIIVKIIQLTSPLTGLTPLYLATNTASYIAIDDTQTVIQSSSPFTNEQRRSLAILGAVIHSNNININTTNEIKAPIVASTNQLHDLMKAIGSLNLEGNIYGAGTTGLRITKSAGVVFGLGINAHDTDNPHQLTIPLQTDFTFRYRLRDSTEYVDTLVVDPDNYDLAGVLTATPNNKFTVQRFNLFQSGLTRTQYGQVVYNNFEDAKLLSPSEAFTTEQNIGDNAIFRAYLIIKEGVTNLATAIANEEAAFVPVDKFGNVVTGGGSVLTSLAIITALGYTPESDANKVTDFSVVNNTVYPTTQAVQNLFNTIDVLATPLTGYVVGANTALAATDTILQAFEKTQGQLNFKITGNGTSGQVAYFTGTRSIVSSTAFAYDNSSQRLNIGNSVGLINGGTGISVFGDTLARFKLTTTASGIGLTDGFEFVLTSTAGFIVMREAFDVNFQTSATTRMTITAGGLVMIGVGTATNTLDVNGTARIRTISNGTGDFLTKSATGVITARTASEVVSDLGAIGGSGTTNYLSKFTSSGSIGNSQIFDNGTNVGIGTSTPNAKLEINNGDIYLFGGSNRRFLVGDSVSVGQYGGFRWQTSNDSVSFGNNASSNNLRNIVIESSGNILLNGNIAGNIGISNTSPTDTLDVNGTARIRTISNGTGDFLTKSATGVITSRTALEVGSDIGAVLVTTDQSIAGVKTFTGQLSVTGTFLSLPTSPTDRGKLRIFGASSEWAIGNQASTTFGRLNNTALTFNVPNTDTQGFWWGDTGHTASKGAMALTSKGDLTVATSLRIGYGESDTDDTVSYGFDHAGTARLAGIPSGTIVETLGLDINNQVVKGAGGGIATSGTFTPVLTDSTGGATYSATATGKYYKIGNLVNFYIVLSSFTTTGTPSGNMEITGLPFSIDTELNARMASFVGSGISDLNLGLITPRLISGTKCLLYYCNANGPVLSVTLSGTGILVITGSYVST